MSTKLLLLTAICEALLAEEVRALRSPVLVAQNALTLIERHPNASLRQDFNRLLNTLSHPIGSLLLTNSWKPFAQLSIADRERRLLQMANARSGLRRQAFQGLKRLIMLITYGDSSEDKPNPLWRQLKYEGAPTLEPSYHYPSHYWSYGSPAESESLQAEFVVIGSGAGGGVVAGRLAEAGHTVIVLEMGGDEGQRKPGMNEMEGLQSLYAGGGIMVTRDSGVMILAGSALGGGTTVNWTTSLRAPETVFEEWVRDYALTEWGWQTFQPLYERVERDLQVQCHKDTHNAPNRALIRGCQALGLSVRHTSRNVIDCQGRCDFCAFGCRCHSKQSTVETYLKQAAISGCLKVLVRAKAQRLLFQNGRAVGAEGVFLQNGQPVPFHAAASKGVVVAAGSLGTPALLLRSGLSHSQLGKNLRLHPTTAVVGHYDEPVYPWKGAPQSSFSSDLLNLDGKGYGVLLETPALYPGIAASSLPFVSAEDHYTQMKRFAHGAALLAIARDCAGGHINLGKDGEPIIIYRLDNQTGSHLLKGIHALTRIHFGAGATEIGTLHQIPVRLYRDNDGGTDNPSWEQRITNAGFAPNRLALFSAHQMGSCRASGNRDQGVVNPQGQFWGIPNLYISDASLFPTALGINPMLTIMACAHWVSDHILSS